MKPQKVNYATTFPKRFRDSSLAKLAILLELKHYKLLFRREPIAMLLISFIFSTAYGANNITITVPGIYNTINTPALGNIIDLLTIQAPGVTIQNSTLTFTSVNCNNPSGKVLVKKGAELTLHNCTLTRNTNDALWNGITVEGTSSAVQNNIAPSGNNPNQGVLILKGSTVIQFAGTTSNQRLGAVNVQGGGIVESHALVTIKNNTFGIVFQSYPGKTTNKSRIVGTNFMQDQLFETTINSCQLFNTFKTSFSFIDLTDCGNIVVSSCNFSFTDPTWWNRANLNHSTDINGLGVKVLNTIATNFASLNLTTCTFTNLSKGVSINSANSIAINTIHHSNFNQVGMGVSADKIFNDTYYKNTFVSVSGSQGQLQGIKVGDAAMVNVYENEFINNITSPVQALNPVINEDTECDIQVVQTDFLGTAPDFSSSVYMNTHNNQSTNGQVGLMLFLDNPKMGVECNQYDDMNFDIYQVATGVPIFLPNTSLGNNSIGSVSKAAGNVFSLPTGTNSNWRVYNDNTSNNIVYGYLIRPDHREDPDNNGAMGGMMFNTTKIAVNNSNTCPSRVYEGPPLTPVFTSQKFNDIFDSHDKGFYFSKVVADYILDDKILEATEFMEFANVNVLMIMPLYLQLKQYDKMQVLINNLKVTSFFQEELIQYWKTILPVYKEGRLTKLNDLEIHTLLGLKASKFTIVSQYAREAIESFSEANLASIDLKPTALIYAYPNPASNLTYLDCSINGSYSIAYIEIIDMTGKAMQRIELNKSNTILSIKTDGIAAGHYFYKLIIDGNQIIVGKMSIVK